MTSETQKQATRAYQQSPKGKYSAQKGSAKSRGIGWGFTFETWWEMWEKSGKWEERGTKYYMCRNGDEGPYAPYNVVINTISENAKEAWALKKEYMAEKKARIDSYRPYDRSHLPASEQAWAYPHTCDWLEVAMKIKEKLETA